MATIDLGKIKQVFRGTYNNATAYAVDDLVVFTDGQITSTYICTTASTGNNPSSGGTAHANWAFIAKGVADPIPSQSGNAGKVLKTDGTNLSFGVGFEGSHYLAYDHDIHHGTSVTVNGNPLANGTADGQRDCIVINNGLYFTVTPAHADDILIMNCTSNIFTNWNSGGTYWGMGFMSSTSTNFANNRNVFYLMGQHAWGQGSSLSNYDNYQNCCVTQQFNCGTISLSAGTTYYIRPIGQVHSANNNVEFNSGSGLNQRSEFNAWLRHYKKVT